MELRVTEAEGVHFPLYLRVPGWCPDFQVTLNEKRIAQQPAAGQYLCLNHTWQTGDVIHIAMKTEITLTEWPNNKSVNCGPLSYSIKIKEKWRKFNRFEMSDAWKESATFSTPRHFDVDIENWPEWEVFPASPLNYGLLIDRQRPAEAFEIRETDAVSGNPWTVETAPIALTVNAKRIPGWSLDQRQTIQPVPVSPVSSDEPVEQITLIPLGCARLRVGCLPVVCIPPVNPSFQRRPISLYCVQPKQLTVT